LKKLQTKKPATLRKKANKAKKTILKAKEDKKNKKKNQKKKDKKEKKKQSPQKPKKPTKKPQTKPAVPKTQPKLQTVVKPQPTSTIWVPSIKSISSYTTLTPVQYYTQFIYYTQPIGYEIFYDDKMTSYQTCSYIGGVSTCESTIKIPDSFRIDSHLTYYGVRFDQC